VVKETAVEDDRLVKLSIRFTDPYGLTVYGIFTRPKADAKYPCVLLFHGAGGRKENMSGRFGGVLAERGIASLSLDAALHGEREGQPQPTGEPRGKLGAVSRITVVDYRIALDYLAGRNDIAARRIGALGYSMGSQLAAIFAGVDARVAATVLYVGGDPIRPTFLPQTAPQRREEIEMVSPSNFIGHISPRPVFMVNGRTDSNITAEMTRLLYDAAKDPKEIAWYDAGHSLPPAAIDRGLDWLKDKLTEGK
jgi:fermentation-respiration switch protein FrsA (DUF1100 family)